ncbi:MAG TPA: hypothetical protein VKH37_09985, partial [Ferruginibacter sp.]|nr:hypothetical protein [Ferruginibacter sp.]
YVRSYAYDNGKFFTHTGIDTTQISDSSGIATFVKLKYSVYSWLFEHNSPAIVTASNNCYVSDTLVPKFHGVGNNETLILELHPLFIEANFKVVDKDDHAALPGSSVTLITEAGGQQYTDTATTDPGGMVNFKKFPKCGKLVKVVATLEGYYPDSIVNKKAEDITGPVDPNRLLQLKPIKKPIEFFVIDCKSKQPIAGATVTIEFDFDGKHTTKTVNTNVDGQGKGTYQDAPIIAKIHLKGSAPYYKDGELPGWHAVGDFINYPKEKRTFCLEPDENTIEFIDVDSLTRKPLENTLNTITIERNGQTIVKTARSNRNGVFPVQLQAGDVVSILAQHPPDYEDNDRKINKADAMKLIKGTQEDRTIPLKPKVFEKPPKVACRVFVSDCFLGDQYEESWTSVIYVEDGISEYVGEGVYPDNSNAFPNAGAGVHTFDGIAIDKGTRVIIYSQKNF